VKLYIIGKTEFNDWFPGKAYGSEFEKRYVTDIDAWHSRELPNDGQTLIEFAGRLCYESWHLPNPDTATNSGYIHNIISQGHESVLEHVSVTFYVEGVSRNLSHELIRHRHLSFSELSQRFVDMEDANFVVPPMFRPGLSSHLCPLADYGSDGVEGDPLEMYREMVGHAKSDGADRKQAREGARAYLPSGMETKFVVTGNLRAWRDVLKKRDSEHADAEMQLFAKEVKRQLLTEYPDVFADLKESNEG
jgi:thymidylate synthase (FAD)